MSKPVTYSRKTISPAKVSTDSSFNPKPALPGMTPISDPSTVSPNSPPSPKLWLQLSPGTSVAQCTAAKATAMTAKTTRPSARSPPRCKRKRPPQTATITGIAQAPRPIRIVRVDATAAPNRPSMFCAGSSVATIQPGSSGE